MRTLSFDETSSLTLILNDDRIKNRKVHKKRSVYEK